MKANIGFFIGIVLLAVRLVNPQGLHRAQLITILIGFVIPFIGTILASAGITFFSQRDATPITFALGNLIIIWSLFRYRLFETMPIARDTLVERMRDGVVVLDAEDHLVDIPSIGLWAIQNVLNALSATLVCII